jgi:hypothetical protein
VVVVGEGVDHRHPGIRGHLLDAGSCSWVRQTIGGLCGPRTARRRRSDSRSPTLASLPSMIIGKPPRCAIAPDEGDLGAQGRLVEEDRRPVGPARHWSENGSALSAGAWRGPRAARLRRGRRRRGGGARWSCGVLEGRCRVEQPGKGVDEQVELVRRDDERRREAQRIRCDGVDDEPGLASEGGHVADTSAVRVMARRDPPRTPVTRGAQRQDPAAKCSPAVGRARSGPGTRWSSSTASPARTRAGCPRTSTRASRAEHRSSLGAEGHQGPDRHAAAESLGQGDRVGNDVPRAGNRTRPGAADAGLDLVDDEQRAPASCVSSRASRGMRRRRGGPRPRPGSAPGPRRRRLRADGRTQGIDHAQGTCVTPGRSGANGSR